MREWGRSDRGDHLLLIFLHRLLFLSNSLDFFLMLEDEVMKK